MAVAGGAVAALILVNAYKLHYLLLPVGAVRTRASLVPYRPSAPPVNADQFFFAVSVARIRSGSWIVDGWVQGRNGHRLTDPLIDRLWGAKDPLAWLHSHDASAWIRYQPGGHYWALQGLESGALLVLALVLAVVTVLVVRRSST